MSLLTSLLISSRMCMKKFKRELKGGTISKLSLPSSILGKNLQPIFTTLPSSNPQNFLCQKSKTSQTPMLSAALETQSLLITSPQQETLLKNLPPLDIFWKKALKRKTSIPMEPGEEMMKSWPAEPLPTLESSTN